MTDFTILLWIAVLLLLAKTFGEIAERLKMSSLVGEIIAGIVAGPLLLIVQPNPVLEEIAGIGVVLFFFIAGLQTKFEDIKKDTYAGSFLALAGILFSALVGFMVGIAFFGDFNVGIVLGIAFLATSSPITIRTLFEKSMLHTKVGKMLIVMNMADEVISIIALSLFSMYISATIEIWRTAVLFFAIIGFFFIVLNVGGKFIDRFLSLFQRLQDEQILLSVPLVIVLSIVFFSEKVILAGVTGAFLVGMAMSKSEVTESVIMPKIKTIGYGFFIPLFFAYSAIIVDLASLSQSVFLITVLVITGVIAKILGSGILAGIYNFRRGDQWLLGIGMVPRGEFGIIIGQIALGAALITAEIYTALVAAIIITVIITPILFRLVLDK